MAQVVALIQRDQAAVIAIVNPNLQPINEFHFGRGARLSMPWLAISAEGPTFITDDNLQYREGAVTVTLEIGVGNLFDEAAQSDAHDYVRVLDIIITSAGPSPALQDWTTPMTIVHDTIPSGV